MTNTLGRKAFKLVFLGIPIIIGLLFVITPFVWMLISSLKTPKEIFQTPITYIPEHPTFMNFIEMWKTKPVLTYYMNSLLVSVVATVVSVAMSAFAGYGFSRFKFKGKDFALIVILLSQMFPHILIAIPFFVWMANLKLIDSYASLILAYIAFSLPFSIWMLKGFFDAVPFELEQSAMIDGCTPTGTFIRIILPLSTPGVASATLFSFLVAWNHYLFSLILVSKEKLFTLTVGITQFIGQFNVEWGQLNAVAVITTFPILILFLFLEKYMVTGLTAGAIKG